MKQTLTGIAILGLLVAAVQPRTNGGDDPRFADLYARIEASAEADELLLELTKDQERRIALLERQFEALPESIGAGLEEG